MIQPIEDSAPRRSWRDPWLWLAVVVLGALLLALSLLRYEAFNSRMLDLGNMAQAIGSLQRGEPLIFTREFGQQSRFALHAELIYLPIGLLYALIPDPRTLLVLQALLAVSGAFPAYRLAARQLESALAGRCAALIYLLYPVMQTAVLFDFHGDTLAMPLLLWALEALDRKAWRTMGLWLALALSCKVYVAAPVFGIGLVLWLRGERRVGAIVAGAAMLYGAGVFFGLRPAAALLGDSAGIEATRNYIQFYFGEFALLRETAALRMFQALIILGPAMLLAWRAPLRLLPAMPIFFAALLSTEQLGSFDYRSHHYALVVPFAVDAIIAGAAALRERGRGLLLITTALVAATQLFTVNTPLSPFFWNGWLTTDNYLITPRDQIKADFLAANLPPGAPIASSILLAPRLTDRAVLFQVRYEGLTAQESLVPRLPELDYVVADALFDYQDPSYEHAAIRAVLAEPSYGLVAMRDGLLVLRRNPAPAERLPQTLAALPSEPTRAPLGQLGPLDLLAAQTIAEGNGRYRLEITWRLRESVSAPAPLLVSQFGAAATARVVHLPSSLVQPLDQLAVGATWRETISFAWPSDLPPPEGDWQIALYAADRVGGQLAQIVVP